MINFYKNYPLQCYIFYNINTKLIKFCQTSLIVRGQYYYTIKDI